MPSRAKVLGDGSIRREKTLRMTGRFEPLPATRALPCRPMRVLTPMIEDNGQTTSKHCHSIYQTLSCVKASGDVAYLLTVTELIACKDARLFDASACPW